MEVVLILLLNLLKTFILQILCYNILYMPPTRKRKRSQSKSSQSKSSQSKSSQSNNIGSPNHLVTTLLVTILDLMVRMIERTL